MFLCPATRARVRAESAAGAAILRAPLDITDPLGIGGISHPIPRDQGWDIPRDPPWDPRLKSFERRDRVKNGHFVSGQRLEIANDQGSSNSQID
jgi:hypothetical protein